MSAMPTDLNYVLARLSVAGMRNGGAINLRLRAWKVASGDTPSLSLIATSPDTQLAITIWIRSTLSEISTPQIVQSSISAATFAGVIIVFVLASIYLLATCAINASQWADEKWHTN
jgi:hypothetical protein